MMGLPSCEQVARLVSESMEHDLSRWQRLRLWLHLSMCRLCSGFRRDLLHLREATRDAAGRAEDETLAGGPSLSPEARQRIKGALERPDIDGEQS